MRGTGSDLFESQPKLLTHWSSGISISLFNPGIIDNMRRIVAVHCCSDHFHLYVQLQVPVSRGQPCVKGYIMRGVAWKRKFPFLPLSSPKVVVCIYCRKLEGSEKGGGLHQEKLKIDQRPKKNEGKKETHPA